MYHVPVPSSPFFRDPDPEPEKVDITKRARTYARAHKLRLPQRYTVRAWLSPDRDIETPYDKGDVYHTDVDDVDYTNPTRAFCKHCGDWARKLDQAGADAVNELFPTVDPEEDDPVALPGDWVQGRAGIKCREAGQHEPDEPLAVRWWREDKWGFTTVVVEVTDPNDREWGYASLGDVEAGTFPYKIDRETGEVESVELDPLTADYPLPDLIDEALSDLRDRRKNRNRFTKLLPWL